MTDSTATEEIQRRIAAGERDLQGAALPGVSLPEVNLKGANLRGANLRGADLHGADLSEAKLVRTDLGMADLGMADFTAADLSGADLRGANLKGANFNGATLIEANLRGADLHGADLRGAKLIRADLSRADLRIADISRADLRGADLRGADLAGANLTNASLYGATLQGGDIRRADLTGANLRGTNLTDTRVDAAVFANAIIGETIFADMDLSHAKGLETLHHNAPSTVGTDTLSRSLGEIPEAFLRGCGLTAWEIRAAKEYNPDFRSAQNGELQEQTIQANVHGRPPRKRILISYSQADVAFVDQIRRLFLDREIFCWVAPHETKGQLRERQSKLAIQHDLALLLVLSEDSVQSDWVEHEVGLARKLEKSLGESVLCPVSLDPSWKTSPWQGRLLEKLTEDGVLSFADWSKRRSMEKQFGKLLERMALFQPRVPTPAQS